MMVLTQDLEEVEMHSVKVSHVSRKFQEDFPIESPQTLRCQAEEAEGKEAPADAETRKRPAPEVGCLRVPEISRAGCPWLSMVVLYAAYSTRNTYTVLTILQVILNLDYIIHGIHGIFQQVLNIWMFHRVAVIGPLRQRWPKGPRRLVKEKHERRGENSVAPGQRVGRFQMFGMAMFWKLSLCMSLFWPKAKYFSQPGLVNWLKCLTSSCILPMSQTCFPKWEIVEMRIEKHRISFEWW